MELTKQGCTDIVKDYINNEFDAETEVVEIVNWIKHWFAENGKGCNATVGISGGKDSSVVAALCVEALGKDRVIGVKMPQGDQKDIDASNKLIDFLGIKSIEVNIADAVSALTKSIESIGDDWKLSKQATTNLPARIRMATLYAVSQTKNGRVANTCNFSEDFVGYATKYGDAAGDFSPLSNYNVCEVIAIGEYLGLPDELVHKTPIDGLNTNEDGSYVTDEQSLGLSYDEIDAYTIKGASPSADKLERMLSLNERAEKKNLMLKYER